jgi:mono/diheme cytochrome c family protein
MKTRNLVRRTSLILTLGASLSAPLASAQPRETLARGELLYNAHCVACHTTQMHWRGKKLVADWDSLKLQVRLWQANDKLGWSDTDITSVALYLNKLHYGYPVDLYGRSTTSGSDQAAANR